MASRIEFFRYQYFQHCSSLTFSCNSLPEFREEPCADAVEESVSGEEESADEDLEEEDWMLDQGRTTSNVARSCKLNVG